jgi:hypothetical protein
LFWRQYLNANGRRRFEHSWLAYKEAERPEDLASARAVKLFTALGYDDTDNQATGSTKPRGNHQHHEPQTRGAACDVHSAESVFAKKVIRPVVQMNEAVRLIGNLCSIISMALIARGELVVADLSGPIAMLGHHRLAVRLLRHTRGLINEQDRLVGRFLIQLQRICLSGIWYLSA